MREADLPLQNRLQFEAYYEDLFKRSLDITKIDDDDDDDDADADSQTYFVKFLNRNKY